MGQCANELDFTGEGVFYGRMSPLGPVTTLPKYPCPHVTGKETAIQGGAAASPRGNPGLCDYGGALSLPGLSGQRSLVWSQPQHFLGSFVKWESEFPPCKLLRGLSQLMGIKCFYHLQGGPLRLGRQEVGPRPVTPVCPQNRQTFRSLYPWGPRGSIRARCPRNARDARDGRGPGAVPLGLGDIERAQQQQQQRQEAAPRRLHHHSLRRFLRGDKKMG